MPSFMKTEWPQEKNFPFLKAHGILHSARCCLDILEKLEEVFYKREKKSVKMSGIILELLLPTTGDMDEKIWELNFELQLSDSTGLSDDMQNTETPFMWLALNLRDADWGTQAHDASNLLQTWLCNKWEFVSNVLCYATISVDGKNLYCKEKTQFIFVLFFVVGDSCGGLDFPLFSNSTLIIWQNLPFHVLQSNSLIISRHSKCRPANCWTLYTSDPNLPISH